MEYLKNLFKNKDRPIKMNLILLAAVGIILLIYSNTVLSPSSRENSESYFYEENSILSESDRRGNSYEENLEKRLIEILSQVEGVGKVDVMISVAYSSEVVLAEDVKTEENSTTETDAQGGTREVVSRNTDSQKIILSGSGGVQQPLILKEIEPKIEGVVIVAEGGDSVLIKEALINAAKTVLGVDSHKVQVLKMK